MCIPVVDGVEFSSQLVLRGFNRFNLLDDRFRRSLVCCSYMRKLEIPDSTKGQKPVFRRSTNNKLIE